MTAEIIEVKSCISFNVYDFRRRYIQNSNKNDFIRIPAIDHDTLVPVIYAITGSNLLERRLLRGCYMNIYDVNDGRYKDCIACIDHRDVKKVRKAFIQAMLNHEDEFNIDNVSYVFHQDDGVSIPNDFIAKKKMLADAQNGLSDMIKHSIEKDNEIGLMIVE